MRSKSRVIGQVARITVDERVKAVIVEWLTAPASGDYRRVLNEALEALKECHYSRWVGDVRHLGAVTEADQQWSNAVWFPEALACGLNKLAVILPDDIFNQLSIEEIIHRVESDDLSHHFFSSMEEALGWIE